MNEHERFAHDADPPSKRREHAQDFTKFTEFMTDPINPKATPESTPLHSPRALVTPQLSGNTLAASSIEHYGDYSQSLRGDSASLLELSSRFSAGSFMDPKNDHYQHSRNQTLSSSYPKSPEMSYDAISSALLSFQQPKSASYSDDVSTQYSGNQNMVNYSPFMQAGVTNNTGGQSLSRFGREAFSQPGFDSRGFFAAPERFPRNNLRDYVPTEQFNSQRNDLGTNYRSGRAFDLRKDSIQSYIAPRNLPPRIDTQLHLYQSSDSNKYGISEDRAHFSAPVLSNNQFASGDNHDSYFDFPDPASIHSHFDPPMSNLGK